MYLSSESNKLNASSVNAYTRFGDCLTFCKNNTLEPEDDDNASLYTPDIHGLFSNCVTLDTLAQLSRLLVPHISTVSVEYRTRYSESRMLVRCEFWFEIEKNCRHHASNQCSRKMKESSCSRNQGMQRLLSMNEALWHYLSCSNFTYDEKRSRILRITRR